MASGEMLSWAEAIVDHKAPHTFDAVFTGFKSAMSLTSDPMDASWLEDGENQIESKLNDRYREHFRKYHSVFVSNKNTLRVMSARKHNTLKGQSSKGGLLPAIIAA
jgi:hypothetical protein